MIVGRRRLIQLGASAATALIPTTTGAFAMTSAQQRPTADASGGGLIDVHAHPSITLYHELVRAYPALDADSRYPNPIFYPPMMPVWSAGQALEMMDRHNVAAQVLSLPDATLGLRGETARKWARHINEAMARIVSDHPGRFAAFAVVPHDDTDSTLAEIEYALDVLKLDGVCTSTNVRGVYLGDATFDPWFAELDRRSAVLFIHPTMPPLPDRVTPPIIEFSFDSARMVMNMVLSGGKRRFPSIKMISTHGGGAMPYLSHRLEIIQPFLGGGITTKQIHDDLRSFYYDLTSCMGPVPLASALAFVDPDRLLMGFDTPYAPELMLADELERFNAFDGITEEGRRRILSGNALSLFPSLAASPT